MPDPAIICLSGSARFTYAYAAAPAAETDAGHVEVTAPDMRAYLAAVDKPELATALAQFRAVCRILIDRASRCWCSTSASQRAPKLLTPPSTARPSGSLGPQGGPRGGQVTMAKLVREKMPDAFRARGQELVIGVVGSAEMAPLLRDKPARGSTRGGRLIPGQIARRAGQRPRERVSERRCDRYPVDGELAVSLQPVLASRLSSTRVAHRAATSRTGGRMSASGHCKSLSVENGARDDSQFL
jgi:hypothetical protein